MRTSPKVLPRAVLGLCALAMSFGALISRPLTSLADEEPKRVLILFGDDVNHPAIIAVNQSFRTSLKSHSTKRVEFYPEYLDMLLQLDEYESELLPLLHRKYDGRKFDSVIALGRPALTLLSRHGHELFPGTPTVFATLDKSDLEGLDLRADVTGIWTEINFKANLDLALDLYPQTTRVVVVGGISPFDTRWINRAREDFQPYAGKFEFQYVLGLTVREQQQALSTLPLNTIVIFVSNSLDHSGNFYNNLEVLTSIAPAANAPLFVNTELQVGAGGVGGRVTSFEALGAELGRISSRVIAGEAPQNITPHLVPTVPMFDSRALKRWDISESRLPAGSVVRNRQPTLWQQYHWYIITIIVAASLQTMLVIWLLITSVRRTQVISALRQSEERFAKAFKSNPQPMSLTILATGRYLDVNDSFLATSGYSREEVVDHTSLDLNIWETPDHRQEFINKLNESGSISNYETKLRTKSGSFRVLLSSAERIDIGGKKWLLLASSDITERKLAQEALQESEARFRNLADTAPVLIWMSGPDKLCTYFNKQWLEFTGRTFEQELGNGWAEGVHPQDYERCLNVYVTAFDRRESFRMEYRLRRADGGFRWIYDHGIPRFSASEEFLGYIGSCVDITDRKEAEDAVHAAKDELRLIADSLPVLVSEIDTNGHYTFNNLAYETWFGEPREQITGRHMRDLLGESVWSAIRPHVERVWEGHEEHYEDYLLFKNGSPRWVNVSQVPVRDQQGEIKGAVTLVSDISESRRTEETLRDLSSRLIAAQEEERSRVARELHDDLSQKMALLSIELEYAGRHITTNGIDLNPTIQKARSAAEEISEDIHRISHQLHPSRLDHLGLVKSVKAFLQEVSTLHDLEIDLRTQGFPTTLPKDVTLCVFRIVQESVRNIIKHSGVRKAEINIERLETELRVRISDEGCGFDTQSERMSSGLGLIGMQERLRLVGGRVAITSAPQQGTRVEVYVPLSNAQPRTVVDKNVNPTAIISTRRDEVALSE